VEEWYRLFTCLFSGGAAEAERELKSMTNLYKPFAGVAFGVSNEKTAEV